MFHRFHNILLSAVLPVLLLLTPPLSHASTPAKSGMELLREQGFESAKAAPVKIGAEVLREQGFQSLKGKKFALVTNHSATVGGVHILDLMGEKGVQPSVIFTPEHGLKGTAEDGVHLPDETLSGIPVRSLYGASKKPRVEDLKGLDVVLFDIQDAGVRFYTYISTMGLAMQAAAQAGVPFVVLDRPNPLGGNYVSGFVRSELPATFTSLYPIPVAHGMTVGELAQMIKGEAMLSDLSQLQLDVVKMQGWRRSMRWPDTGLSWVPTSPNIAQFDAALLYPGTGLLEATGISEGRGSNLPFRQAGWPGVDPDALAQRLNSEELPGVRFEPVRFTPVSMPGSSSKPKHRDKEIGGVRVEITDYSKVLPVETGVALLVAFHDLVPEASRSLFFRWGFEDMAGSDQLRKALLAGERPSTIMSRWSGEIDQFLDQRKGYLIYRD